MPVNYKNSKTPGLLIVPVLCLILFAASLSISSASTFVPVGDDTYEYLSILEAEGVITSGMLSARPISRSEVVRLINEADERSADRSLFIRSIVRSLKDRYSDDISGGYYFKALDSAGMEYSYADNDPDGFVYNNDGYGPVKGSNLRINAVTRLEHRNYSFYFEPEFRLSDDESILTLGRMYGAFMFGKLEIQAGKDSQWWGPGYHGAILLSNNAEPFTMVKLGNSTPFRLPWVFRHIGDTRITFFATRLEEDRAVPEPFLWGMRFDFKPSRYFEFGIHRTALLGGEGRSSDLDTWWRSFLGEGEHVAGEPGDQRGGLDIKFSVPLSSQPFQVYGEVIGEDSVGVLPEEFGFLAGLYLPRVSGFERLALRIEYSDNYWDLRNEPNVFYSHHLYTTGYTYDGEWVGHHMGSDSTDMFIQISYLVPERDARVDISYDLEKHGLSTNNDWKEAEISLRTKYRMAGNIELDCKYTYGLIYDTGSAEQELSLISIALDYHF
ncbi:MAG: capsule assembly Wzi family protein [Nitrospirota bacterium]|nr:MAG: capsule assembly Wzi family protein [Nitrospirota bacterium]